MSNKYVEFKFFAHIFPEMNKTPEQEKVEVEAAFKKMESYNPTDKTIKVADFENLLVKALNYPTTPEQAVIYKKNVGRPVRRGNSARRLSRQMGRPGGRRGNDENPDSRDGPG